MNSRTDSQVLQQSGRKMFPAFYQQIDGRKKNVQAQIQWKNTVNLLGGCQFLQIAIAFFVIVYDDTDG